MAKAREINRMTWSCLSFHKHIQFLVPVKFPWLHYWKENLKLKQSASAKEEKRLGIVTRKMEGLVPSQISVKERRQTKVSICYL